MYAGWAGPCVSMISVLKRVKGGLVDDTKLILATAKSDSIEELAPFRKQSEPTWLFMAGVM